MYKRTKKKEINRKSGKSRKSRKSGKSKKSGGKALGAGGFGCVFYPALKCRGEKERPKNYVSKLMYRKFADEEINEINKVQLIIDSIPDNEKYFIPNSKDKSFSCDLDYNTFLVEDYTDSYKCTNLYRNKQIFNDLEAQAIISSNYPNYKIIQQAYGGENFSNYLNNTYSTKNYLLNDFKNEFYPINLKLIELMINGIKPMNDRGLLHLDIKSDNLLYDKEKDLIRLIDWGFVYGYKSNYCLTKSFLCFKFLKINDMSNIKDKINFNTPFSAILFDKEIQYFINLVITNNEHLFQSYSILSQKEIEDLHFDLINVFDKILNLCWNKINNKSHWKKGLVKQFIELIYNKKLSNNQIKTIFKDYLFEIIINNIDNGEFNIINFFNSVYSNNVDIYGWLTSYLDIYIILNTYKNEEIKVLNNKLRLFLKQYLFETHYANKAYDIKIIKYNLDDIFKPIKITKSSSKEISSKNTSYLNPSLPIKSVPVHLL